MDPDQLANLITHRAWFHRRINKLTDEPRCNETHFATIPSNIASTRSSTRIAHTIIEESR